jgi:putative Holliday junction resolvase
MSGFSPLDDRPRSFLSFDFGTRRTGVASGNSLTRTATPLTTISEVETDKRFARIGRLLAEWQPDALVVGIPRHPDGAPHENTLRAERFARQLAGRFRLPVHTVDERYTSVEAESLGACDVDAASLGACDVDAASAALILEQFLREFS